MYPIDLDEIKEKDLKDEIQRRQDARLKGLCDYCFRSPDSASCKFPDRHNDARIERRPIPEEKK